MTEHTQHSDVYINNVSGGIHGSAIAGRDLSNTKLGTSVDSSNDSILDNHPALQALRKILSVLYDTEEDARRIAHESDLDTSHINFSTKPVNFWSNLLLEACKQGKVKIIVAIVTSEYPKMSEKIWDVYKVHSSADREI